MKALDLFCGAGGSTMGLLRTGFDVVGIDNNRKRGRRYPATFVCGNALDPPVKLTDFDFIWASPPCQHFSVATPADRRDDHPDLIAATRDMLKASGVPYVIENVPQAPIRADVVLTGAMFDLDVVRRRHFEVSGYVAPFSLAPQDWRRVDKGELASVAGGGCNNPIRFRGPAFKWRNLPLRIKEPLAKRNSVAGWRDAMGIDWMTKDELREAIPPSYSEYIARQFLRKE